VVAVNDETLKAIVRMQHERIVGEVLDETDRQLQRWNVQDHPAGNGPEQQLLQHTDINLDLRTGSELEHIFRDKCEARFKLGEGTYFDILLEEVFEAGAASTPEEYEKEMEQVAAVAVSAIAASRRSRGA
jgi:hypothetical protein